VRVGVVIEAQISPAHGFVTLVAAFSIASPVLIIVLMTRDARFALRVILKVSAMTRAAEDIAVSTGEREFGFRIVVERRFFPSGGGMTAVTAITAPTRMTVIKAVTADTRSRRTVIAFVDMTLLTAHITMLIMQWKICLTMVESRAAPSTDIMATLATFT
jgi:hypothetical protein